MTEERFGLTIWERAAARARMPLTATGGLGMLVAAVAEAGGAWFPAMMVVFAAGMALYFRVGTPHGEPVDLTTPGEGRWRVLNSPGSRIPSHGIHAWSQTHAVDLVPDPEDGSRPGFATRPVTLPASAFPGFGRPVHSPVDGVIIRARGGMRDHRSRNSPLGLAYFALESVRELLGPAGVLGNHLVIREPGGAYVLLAHLRRGSLRVRPGDEVTRGRVVGECGNSGNSTEPHVHLQAMDRASVWVAAGLPILLDGRPLPPDNAILDAEAPAPE